MPKLQFPTAGRILKLAMYSAILAANGGERSMVVNGQWSMVNSSRTLRLICDLAPPETYCRLPIADCRLPINIQHLTFVIRHSLFNIAFLISLFFISHFSFPKYKGPSRIKQDSPHTPPGY
jgi:hypothetical protein